MGLSEYIQLNPERVKQVQDKLSTVCKELSQEINGLHSLEVAIALEQLATAIRYKERQKAKAASD